MSTEKQVPFSKTNEILCKIKNYLHYITNSILSMESITINRPLKQVFEYIMEFNRINCETKKENKKSIISDYVYIDILFIRLSNCLQCRLML